MSPFAYPPADLFVQSRQDLIAQPPAYALAHLLKRSQSQSRLRPLPHSQSHPHPYPYPPLHDVRRDMARPKPTAMAQPLRTLRSRMTRSFCRLLTAVLTLAASPSLCLAEAPAQVACPSKPIRLVVPFAAGSAPDALARLLATALTESMSVAVVVDNVPGAGGTIGVDRVAKAAADGHTLVLAGDAALVLSDQRGQVTKVTKGVSDQRGSR